MVRVRGRLRPVGFYDYAIAIVTMTAMLREVREVGAAGPLSWTDWLGISGIELGIRRFELAGALVVRQRE